MAKLVFDIETTALPLEGFDAEQSEYLFRDAENICPTPRSDWPAAQKSSASSACGP
jgi:hypothetical protein